MPKKTLPKGILKKLQSHIAYKMKERGFEDATLQQCLLLLTEEIGELTQACRKISGIYVKSDKKFNLAGEEIVDIINVVLAVAVKLELDVEKEFLAKEKILDKRKYVKIKQK